MLTRAQCAADARTDDELIADAIRENQLDEAAYAGSSHAFAVLLWRSGPGLLERAIALTRSGDWMRRELGADLLGQIHDASFREADERAAWSDAAIRCGYPDQAMGALLALADTEACEDVIESIAWALGHRADPRGVPALERLAADARVDIRYAATHALGGCGITAGTDAAEGDPDAGAVAMRIAATLIALAGDDEGDIRDWALFGLHQLGLDTPAIRDTFAAHVADPHHDAMTEALSGLAYLGDRRGLAPLRELVERGDDCMAVIDACTCWGDPSLVPALKALQEHPDDTAHGLGEAIAACSSARGWQPWQQPWRHPVD